eukprot:1043181-Prorocentrum_lima.AAC.1
MELLERAAPTLVVLSPPCTWFSQMQRINKVCDPLAHELAGRLAKRMVMFAMQVAAWQRGRG